MDSEKKNDWLIIDIISRTFFTLQHYTFTLDIFGTFYYYINFFYKIFTFFFFFNKNDTELFCFIIVLGLLFF